MVGNSFARHLGMISDCRRYGLMMLM